MFIIVGCEESQAVCIEFRKRGHEAYSCDLQACSGGHPEWHFQMDVLTVINGGWLTTQAGTRVFIKKWDKGIFHPPCTFICNSGVRWLKGNPERFEKMLKAVQFFVNIKEHCEAKKIPYCLENPIPHKYAVQDFSGYKGIGKYTQLIQPWMFGDGEIKATCFWLWKLPKLKWSKEDNLFENKTTVEGREARIHKMAPCPDRSKLRSKTYTGIAQAMAEQWG